MQVALCGGVKVKVKNCLEISADISGLRERRGACSLRLGSHRSPSRRCLSDKKCYARIFIRARALLGQVAGATLHAPGWMPRYTTRESWLLTHAQTSGPASARWSRDLLHSSQMHRSHSHPFGVFTFMVDVLLAFIVFYATVVVLRRVLWRRESGAVLRLHFQAHGSNIKSMQA